MTASTIKKLFYDKSFIRFVLVGVVNTLVGLTIMFSCYNLLHLGYWLSSAMDYTIASVMSYFLNKHFTFGYHEKGWWSLARFAVNIVACYFIAFSLARPFVRFCLEHLGLNLGISTLENISMLVGSAFFVIINYLGQRFFAFRGRSTD